MFKAEKYSNNLKIEHGNNNSFVEKLDPRGKILITFLFILCVVSNTKYEVFELIPYFSFPVFIVLAGNIPSRQLLKKLLPAAVFAVVLASFNPILDHNSIIICSTSFSAGWISFVSIMLRVLLTSSVAFLLVMTTEWYLLNNAMRYFGVPEIFINQMFFMERYLYELLNEANNISQARASRSFGKNGYEIKVYGHLVAALLNRSFDKAQRIYEAMQARGYTGVIPSSEKLQWKTLDTIHTIIWIMLFLIIRTHIFQNFF